MIAYEDTVEKNYPENVHYKISIKRNTFCAISFFSSQSLVCALTVDIIFALQKQMLIKKGTENVNFDLIICRSNHNYR